MAMRAPEAPDYCVGVVGAGAMGQGIAQVSVQGGMRTLLVDAREGAAAAARDTIAGRLNRLVEKGRMGQDAADAAIALLEPVQTISDLAPCDTVVEAIVEDLEVKRQVFAEIEAAVSPDTLIASNTSSIPIAAIARACTMRDRVAGLHFFNPVPLMRLVEVIRAAETSEATVDALTAIGQRMTRTPVVVQDSPGFLVNMGGRAYTTEALRIAHEGVATPAQVDAIMRDCWGFPMGPFELMDLTGIDVNYPVSQIIWEGYGQDPRLKTSPNHRAMFDAGLYGRKTGQGWFAYENGQPLPRPSPDHAGDAVPVAKVALGPDTAEALAAFCDILGLSTVPDGGSGPILAAPTGIDAAHMAATHGLDHRRLVALDLAGDTSKRVTIMTAPGADPAIRDRVAATLTAAGRQVTAIKDSPGFVGPRMVAMIANLGCYMAEIGLAAPQDIDTAMQLGLNYPHGPLALAEHLGTADALRVMEALQQSTGDDRYRPTPWLKRRVLLGLPIHTPS